jgi:putative membrane protein
VSLPEAEHRAKEQSRAIGIPVAVPPGQTNPQGTIMKIRALAMIATFALPTLTIAEGKAPPADTYDKTTEKTDKPAKLSDADMAIISHLHHVNQMEIDLGKAARKNGTANVKSYSDMLISEHQSTDKDLTSFAKKRGHTTIPADKPETDAAQQEHKDLTQQIAHLKTLKGAEFDREFLNIMVSTHGKAVARVDAAIGTVSDPDLRTMLTSIKSVLQRHSDQAQELQKKPQASTK